MGTFGGRPIQESGQSDGQEIVPAIDPQAAEGMLKEETADNRPAKQTFAGKPIEGPVAPVEEKSPTFGDFLMGSLKKTGEVIQNESMAAHLYRAYEKGVFKKTLGELVGNATNTIEHPQETLSSLWGKAKKDPGEFALSLMKGIVADPELMFAPVGLGGRVAAAGGKVAGAVGRVAGRAAETGAVGGGLNVAMSAAQQLDEQGVVDPRRIASDLQVGAALGAALGTAVHLGADIAGVKPSHIYDDVRRGVGEGKTVDTSIEEALKKAGVSRKKASAIADSLEEAQQLEKDGKLYEAKMKDGEVTAEEAKVQEPSAKEKKEFQNLLKQHNATPEQLRTETMEEAAAQARTKVDANQRAINAEMEQEAARTQAAALQGGPQKVNMGRGVVVGSAEAARAKPGFERSADDLLALRRERELSAKMEDLPKELPEQLSKHEKQAGFADPEFMKYLALASAGAVGGYYLTKDPKGSVLGAALAIGGVVGGKALLNLAKPLVKEKLPQFTEALSPPKVNIEDTIRDFQGEIAAEQRRADVFEYAAKKYVPDAERRKQLTFYAQEPEHFPQFAPRTHEENILLQAHEEFVKDLGKKGMDAGSLEHVRDNYVTQMWDFKDNAARKQAQAVFSSMSGKSRFGHEKVIPSYRVGMQMKDAQGNALLKPKTLDLAEIDGEYGRQMATSIAKANFLNKLKSMTVPEKVARVNPKTGKPLGPATDLKGEIFENPLLVDAASAPFDYVSINHPQLMSYKVHPDIAPDLSFFFYTKNTGAAWQALQAVSFGMKALAFSFSLFHDFALTEGLLAASRFLKRGPSAMKELPGMYKKWKLGEEGDIPDIALRKGLLNLAPHTGIDAQKNVVTKMLTGVETILNMGQKYGAGTLTAKPLLIAHELGSKFLWDYLHPVFKLATFSSEYKRGLLENAKLAEQGKPIRSPDQIARDVGQFVNDTFGGLNWHQVASDVESQFGKALAKSMMNPKALDTAQLLLKAPDWTVATFRSGFIGSKAIAKTLLGMPVSEKEKLYRAYTTASYLQYATIADALNMAFTGHHFWQNKDKTRVELGDGRTMQLNKHAMEYLNWIQHPGQEGLNKLGFLPSEALEQMMGVEYLRPGGKAPTMKSHMGHLIETILPITAKGKSFASIVPIYGETQDEKEKRKLAQELERLLKKGKTE